MQLTGQRVLAFGTAGAQGSGLVPSLLEQGAVPIRATSSPERADQWRAAGEQAIVADLTDSDAVLGAAEKAEAVAVTTHIPLSLTAEGSGSNDGTVAVIASIRALRGHGVAVTVNIGAPAPPAGAPDAFGNRWVSDALLEAGATVLTPTAYLENHAAPWATARMAGGELIYARPATDPIAWIAAADMGRGATAALAHDIAGELVVLAGPQALTFDDLAREFGAGLGRDLRFVRVSPTEYGAALAPYLGDQAAAGVAAAYESMSQEPNPFFNPTVAEANWQRLGISPTTARAWAGTVLLGAFQGYLAAAPGSRDSADV